MRGIAFCYRLGTYGCLGVVVSWGFSPNRAATLWMKRFPLLVAVGGGGGSASFWQFRWLACSITAPLLIHNDGWLVIDDSAGVIWVFSLCFDLCVCQIKVLMFPLFSFSVFMLFCLFLEVVSPP